MNLRHSRRTRPQTRTELSTTLIQGVTHCDGCRYCLARSMGGQMPGRRILALVALLGCAATACSDADSDPPPDKPATHSSIDSPTTRSAPSDPVVNAPALPRGARKHSLAGAEAFVRHYIDLLNYAANTGIVTELRRAARHCD